MRLTLLGTGASSGWPNPWCGCASCRWARADAGRVRGQTSVLVGDPLVDDVLLVDCGPDVPRSAARLGVDLGPVRHVLLGHAHDDHVEPAAFMWRWWSTAARDELTVVGPPAALAVVRDFLTAHAGAAGGGATPPPPVRFVEAVAGARLDVGGYEVRPLAAHHGGPAIGPAVLYDITTPDGSRLLYASDTTTPLPEATLDAVAGRGYTAVALEETFGDRPEGGQHLGLDTFALVVAELRRRGAIVDATRLVAVHLGHGNPPGPELERRLALMGAEAPPDGTVLDLPAGAAPSAAPARPPARVLVTGGARSGKSAEAERRLLACPDVVYVATAGAVPPGDAEWAARVDAHRARRPAGWTTIETTDLVTLLAEPGPPLLVDSLTMWASAHLDGLVDALAALMEAWRGARRPVVAVTDEVGSGVVPATELGRRFRDALGTVNAAVAGESDEVWHVVAGIATRLR